ncbi:MAG TPA: outer membrane beta-barrel protein [Acidobacteriota bacterium]|nr:outer membrane beta-barrel protein [Acidobacteriota bacterium]
MKLTIAALSLCSLLVLASSPLRAEEGQNYNAEIHFFAGGFLGNSVIVTTGNPLFNEVDGVFDNDFIGGARLTYFFNPVFGIEGGIGFTPASILASSNINGGTQFASVINVDTYIFNANLVAQMPRGPVQPFATGGVAAIHFRFNTTDFGPQTPSETDLAINLGGGLKIPVKEDVMLRAEGRYYWANSDFTKDKVTFTEVSGGVAIRFNF